jgi:anaerobic selenocysteine-containing dehydrogenase
MKDNWMTETVTHWCSTPESKNGEVMKQEIQTEVFIFPSVKVGETEASFANTERLLRRHFKAAKAPGDCRAAPWFTYELGKRLNLTMPWDLSKGCRAHVKAYMRSRHRVIGLEPFGMQERISLPGLSSWKSRGGIRD